MKRKYVLYPYQISEYLIYKKFKQGQMNAKCTGNLYYIFKRVGVKIWNDQM